MRLLAVAGFAVLALAVAPAAIASETHPTSFEVESELWCDDCQTTLDEANAISDTPKIMGFIQDRISAGDTKSEIKAKTIAAYRYHVSALPSAAKQKAAKTTLADLEGEVMCPVCNTTLDQSSSPAAQQIKTFISQQIAAGDSKSEIKDKLVAEYGPQILAAPPKKGFNLLAWLLPIVGVLGGALVLAGLAWRWSRGNPGPPPAAVALDPALEQRIDQEIARFDES
ncbi:MAG: cytochrome c-type biogenesis protein [Actinomycetota bacterium]